jgi:hypothetical protein
LKLSFQKFNWADLAASAFALLLVLSPMVLPGVANAQQPPAIQCPQDLGYLCTDGSVASMFRLILNWALTLAFLLAVIYLIIGGFQYITSAGNTEKATKGRATVVNSVIGIVIIILSYTIVQIVYKFVSGAAGVSGP